MLRILIVPPISLFSVPFPTFSFFSDWKSLYKALRSSDSSRTGSLDQTMFQYHLMEFGVTLDNEELTFLSTTMGANVGPKKQYGMSLSRSQSASIQRGKRRPSMSLSPLGTARPWGNSLRRSIKRPQTATMHRSVQSLGARQINYSAFMKQFVLGVVGGHSRPGSALKRGTIDRRLLD